MKSRDLVFILVLILILFGLYWRSFNSELVWDDKVYFGQNLLFAENKPIVEAFKRGYLRDQMGLDNSDLYYRPLLAASFMLEKKLWGLNPASLRIVNLLIYIGGLTLLFVFLKKQEKRAHFAEMATMLFALNPINADNIVWVVGRGDLFLLLWGLLSMIFLNRAIEKKDVKGFAFSSLFFLLGMLSKETFLFIAPLLIIIELVKSRKLTVGYHLANALIAGGFFLVKNGVLGIGGLKLAPYTDLWELFRAAIGALGYYFRTLLFPLSFRFFIPTDEVMGGLYIALGIAAVATFLILLIRFRGDRSLYIPLSLCAIFMAAPIPLILTNLYPFQIYSRYMMLPALGLAWIAAYHLTLLKERVRLAVLFLILVLFIPSIVLVSGSYRSEIGFWRRMNKECPKNAYVHIQLAKTLFENKDPFLSEAILNNALRLTMKRETAILLSLLYSDIDYGRADYDNVERWMQSIEALEGDPNIRLAPFIRYSINYRRAQVAASKGSPSTAEPLLKSNLAGFANIKQSYTELYHLYLGQGMWEAAGELERKMKRLFPRSYTNIDAVGLRNEFEASSFEKKISFYIYYRNFGKALDLLRQAPVLDIDHGLLQAKLLYWGGRPQEGEAAIKSLALPLNDDYARLNRIGDLYLRDLFRAREALPYYKRSLELNKKQPDLIFVVNKIENAYLPYLKPVWDGPAHENETK